MRRRPWILVVLALLHFLAPLGNIAMNAIFSKKGVMDYFIFAMQPKYLSVNWPIIVAPIVAGIAIYACKKWSFFVYLLAISSLFFFSYHAYLSKSDLIGLGPVIFFYSINILVVAYFLIPAVREIYFNPRLRWWETKPRYMSDFNCSYYCDNKTYRGIIGNFSEGGLFLKSKEFPTDDTIINVEFEFNGQTAKFKGKTILHSKQNTVGFGVQFIHKPESFQMAKSICTELDKEGKKMSFNNPTEQDKFGYWVKNLVTTGKGIIPRKD